MKSSDITSFAIMNLFYFICFFCISTGSGLTKAELSKPTDVRISVDLSSLTAHVSWKLPSDRPVLSTYIDFTDSLGSQIEYKHVKAPNISYTTKTKLRLNHEYTIKLSCRYSGLKDSKYVSMKFTPAGKPDPVQYLALEEQNHNSVRISFKAGSDGGLVQSFSLRYTPSGGTKSNLISETIETDDTRPGVTIYYTIIGLKPSTLYNLTLISGNSHGQSSTFMYFNTTNEQISGALIPLPVVVGGSVGIVLFLFVLFVLIRRRKTNKVVANHGNHSSITEQDVTACEGNGAEHACVSQEDKITKRATGNVAEYACVTEVGKNTIITTDETTTPDDGEYAAMDKTKTTKGSFKCLQGESSEIRSQNKNAEGLLYIEVEFATKSNKSTNTTEKQLIITDENSRTDYIDIDFTKKADPLPESDTEQEVDMKE